MQQERYAVRDISYSAWHRTRSISRYVGLERAQSLCMVDVDTVLYLEVDAALREPLALVEVAQDVGQVEKPASAMARLAAKAGIAAYVALYRIGDKPNPADPMAHDITGFRVKRLWPSQEVQWRTLTPMEWAKALVGIRRWSAGKIRPANDPVWERAPEQGVLFGA